MHIHLECNLWSFEYADLNVPHLLLWHCAGLAANGLLKVPLYVEAGLGGIRDQIFVLEFFYSISKKVVLVPFAFTPASSQGCSRTADSCVINKTGEKHTKLTVHPHRRTSSCVIGSHLAGSRVTQVHPSAGGRGLVRTDRHGGVTAKKPEVPHGIEAKQPSEFCRKPQKVWCRDKFPNLDYFGP